MTAVLDAKDAYIEPEARIDASTLVKGDITDQNLNEALWNAEKSLLEIISFDSSIVHQAVYVGATKRSLGDRASEHFSCLRESLKKEQVMSPLKEQVLVRALLSGYHVRISRIIFNIPPKREGVFEVLVTYLLLAQESGGSAVSATAAR
ncbi:MAG: hypothetical protein BWZ03_00627 [bacterium ADurb.BinA186]|nr:MAG: hypothetical protein BWZ03_00627 [bacterium ADurb.BinA186]